MTVRCQCTVIGPRQSAPGVAILVAVLLVMTMTKDCFVASTGRVRLTSDSVGISAMSSDEPDQERSLVINRQTSADSNDDGGYVQLDSEMENTTGYERDTVRIKCDITGYPLPRYKWYKDGNSLDAAPKSSQLHLSVATASSDQRRLNVKTTPWGSRLKLSNVTLRDAGLYTCEGFNQYGRQLTSGRLIVRQGPNPNRNKQKQMIESDDEDYHFDPDTADDISSMNLPSADDTPVRRILSLDGAGVDRSSKTGLGSPSSETSKSSNDDKVRSRFSASDEDHHDADLPDDDDYAEDGGSCRAYQGSACSKFVGNKNVFGWSGRKQSQLDEQLTALFKATSRLSPLCADYLVPTLCYVAFPPCRMDVSLATDMDNAGTGGGRSSLSSDSRRGRVPKRRIISPSSASSSSTTARRRQPLCNEDCRVLDENSCRLEFIAMISAAAAATTGNSRRQQQSLNELLRMSWCPLLGDGEPIQQRDDDCVHLSTPSQRAINITADLVSSQLGHEYPLQRALIVVVPCAVLPLLIALLLLAVRRCRRVPDSNQRQQQQQQQQHCQQSVVAVGAPVKDPIRVVAAQQTALNYTQQLQQYQNGVNEQWTRRAPSLSHSDAACSWSSSQNEAGPQRQAPQTAAHLNDISPWNLHRLHAAVTAVDQPPGYRVNVLPPGTVHHHIANHQLPPYVLRQQMMAAAVHPAEVASSSSSHNYYPHPMARPYYCSRRPGTPASATTSGGGGGGRSMTPKPSPTPSLSADHYGNEMQLQHSPTAVTSYYGYDGATWVGGGHQHPVVQNYVGGPVIGRRTSSGTDKSNSGFGGGGCTA